MSSSVPVVGATTLLQFGNGATPTEVFATVPGVISVPSVGNSLDYVDTTPIDMALGTSQRTTVPADPTDFNFEMNDLTANTAQQTFLDIVKDAEECNMKVVYPNGRTGAFRVKFAGYDVVQVERKTQLKINVKGQKITDVTWTIT